MDVVRHHPEQHRFTLDVDGHQGVLDYRLNGEVMTITHTGVPNAIAGRGVAAELMRVAVKTAETNHWSIDPACSYAAAYLRRHPMSDEESTAQRVHGEALLDEALDESFPASDPPSVGSVD